LVHDLLLRTGWADAAMDLILRTAIQPFGPRRFTIESVPVMVGSRAAQSLTLILHELATNAVKYGALSNVEGRVAITGDEDAPGQRVRIVWKETDGPRVREPERRGLGTRLIVDSLPSQLGATTRLSFPPSGVVFELDLPVASLRAD
jgi:two-component sensor histidine kinase